MKLSIVAVLLFSAVALAMLDLQADTEWVGFTQKFGRTYQNEQEALVRYKIFKSNMKKAAALQSQDAGTAVYGNTPYADMTQEEFHAARLMAPIHANEARNSCLAHGVRTPSFLRAAPLEETVDWRTRDAVSPVKNQGSCGSCWTFSVTGNIESLWYLAGNKMTLLSEQQIVDCDHECSYVGEPPHQELECNQGCHGGWPWAAMLGLVKMGGIQAESDYKYTARDGKCVFDKSKVVAKISNYTCLPTDEDEIAAYLAKNGPLAVALDAGFLQFYSGGIANPSSGCNPKQLTHAVLLVGYGTENGKPYWIVKNSWGERWGEKGYFRLIRGQGKCGINNAVCSAIL